jgi:hypothetical protein
LENGVITKEFLHLVALGLDHKKIVENEVQKAVVIEKNKKIQLKKEKEVIEIEPPVLQGGGAVPDVKDRKINDDDWVTPVINKFVR